MRNLAGMYGSGRGTADDQEAAGRWFKAAAEGGDAQGQFAYGNWYVQDREEKMQWLQKAAQQNHREAIALLGEMNIEVERVELEDAPLPPKLAAVCLQQQLNAAGYNVGTVDGDIGPRSIAAAQSYSNDNGLELADLTPDSAEKWCRALADHAGALVPFLVAAIEQMDAENAAYGPGGNFRYEIAGGVPADQIDLIKTGLSLAERYLEANLGGGTPQDIRRDVTVKIVATGRGNEEPGGDNGAAQHSPVASCAPFSTWQT